MRATGFKDSDFTRPFVGIASTWANVTPCNMHINELAREAEKGVNQAGGKGINVARVLTAQNLPCTAVVLATKDDPFTDEIRSSGLNFKLVETNYPVRRS
ncbi:MAG: dihydroxy-acid dehydratase, partial [Aurantimicrobium sp.]